MARSRALSPRETKQRLRSLGLERGSGRGFTFEENATDLAYDFHTHRRHQLLYAMQGTARLESERAAFLLPPQRAAWIPAGVRHATHVNGAALVSVYFERALAPAVADVQVFDVPALLREMILYSRRWPLMPKRRARDADAYFSALLGVVFDLMQHRVAYELPRPSSTLVARAMDFCLEHLETADLAGAARAAHASPRTLRRRFTLETRLAFRAFLTQARIQRAIELLSESSRSVLEVALTVGFASQSAFTQAFRRALGQTPSAFRANASLTPTPFAATRPVRRTAPK